MESDQRKTFRILVPEGQEQAVLKIGRRSASVRMVDSSAGGFAVASPEALTVKRGDVLQVADECGLARGPRRAGMNRSPTAC